MSDPETMFVLRVEIAQLQNQKKELEQAVARWKERALFAENRLKQIAEDPADEAERERYGPPVGEAQRLMIEQERRSGFWFKK